MTLWRKLAAKSPAEVIFRLRQEAVNLLLLVFPPAPPPLAAAPLAGLPPVDDPPELLPLAQSILGGEIPLLGYVLKTSEPLPWRTDWLRDRTSPITYFRRIPYLDCEAVGDHKLIWELNRHQHLVVLAQAFRQSRQPELLATIERQLTHWMDENPFQQSINWTSALEVAFRALSWIWIHHFAGAEFSAAFAHRFQTVLCWHGAHLAANLSIYFSPNTHLLGEAVALHALGALFPAWPNAATWRALGREQTLAQMVRQVRPDGSHFEQSSYYHVYSVDLFRFHSQIEPAPPSYLASLARMDQYLSALTGPDGRMPFFGDDDGGRLFHPYGDRSRFGGAPPGLEARYFPDSGLCVMVHGQRRVWIDAGPFGAESAGHSHADTLSVVVSDDDRELLIDPGTYTYTGDAEWRERFRSSAAHSTISFEGREQAIAAGPFRWLDLPRTAVDLWTGDHLDARCEYGGFTHRRRVWWTDPDLLLIVDDLTGPPEAVVRQTWRPASPSVHLLFSHPWVIEEAWRSRVHGAKEPAPAWVVNVRGPLPLRLAAALDFTGQASELRLDGEGIWLDGQLRLRLPADTQ